MPNPYLLLLNCRLHTQTIWCVKIGFGAHAEWLLCFSNSMLFVSITHFLGWHRAAAKWRETDSEERIQKKAHREKKRREKSMYLHNKAHLYMHIHSYILPRCAVCWFYFMLIFCATVPLLMRMNLCASVVVCVYKCCAQQVDITSHITCASL